jgi:hypothetical protein
MRFDRAADHLDRRGVIRGSTAIQLFRPWLLLLAPIAGMVAASLATHLAAPPKPRRSQPSTRSVAGIVALAVLPRQRILRA